MYPNNEINSPEKPAINTQQIPDENPIPKLLALFTEFGLAEKLFVSLQADTLCRLRYGAITDITVYFVNNFYKVSINNEAQVYTEPGEVISYLIDLEEKTANNAQSMEVDYSKTDWYDDSSDEDERALLSQRRQTKTHNKIQSLEQNNFQLNLAEQLQTYPQLKELFQQLAHQFGDKIKFYCKEQNPHPECCYLIISGDTKGLLKLSWYNAQYDFYNYQDEATEYFSGEEGLQKFSGAIAGEIEKSLKQVNNAKSKILPVEPAPSEEFIADKTTLLANLQETLPSPEVAQYLQESDQYEIRLDTTWQIYLKVTMDPSNYILWDQKTGKLDTYKSIDALKLGILKKKTEARRQQMLGVSTSKPRNATSVATSAQPITEFLKKLTEFVGAENFSIDQQGKNECTIRYGSPMLIQVSYKDNKYFITMSDYTTSYLICENAVNYLINLIADVVSLDTQPAKKRLKKSTSVDNLAEVADHDTDNSNSRGDSAPVVRSAREQKLQDLIENLKLVFSDQITINQSELFKNNCSIKFSDMVMPDILIAAYLLHYEVIFDSNNTQTFFSVDEIIADLLDYQTQLLMKNTQQASTQSAEAEVVLASGQVIAVSVSELPPCSKPEALPQLSHNQTQSSTVGDVAQQVGTEAIASAVAMEIVENDLSVPPQSAASSADQMNVPMQQDEANERTKLLLEVLRNSSLIITGIKYFLMDPNHLILRMPTTFGEVIIDTTCHYTQHRYRVSHAQGEKSFSDPLEVLEFLQDPNCPWRKQTVKTNNMQPQVPSQPQPGQQGQQGKQRTFNRTQSLSFWATASAAALQGSQSAGLDQSTTVASAADKDQASVSRFTH